MKKLFLILLISTTLVACKPAATIGETINANGGSYKNITPTELNAILKNKDFVFVNVHIP